MASLYLTTSLFLLWGFCIMRALASASSTVTEYEAYITSETRNTLTAPPGTPPVAGQVRFPLARNNLPPPASGREVLVAATAGN